MRFPPNLYCAVYQEELCGYMAGYAAVKLGYKNLGFLGGMAVPAVQRYGYGFVQGVDAAAAELELTDVKVNYAYGNQFFGDADITAAMDTWYAGGTEVVFACGGGIYTSAVDAAKKVEGAKVIGVDVDQAAVIANYAAGEGADHSALLAKELDADFLIILTAVEKAAIHFGTPDQKWLDDITVDEAKQYIKEGHFAPGSMLPKMQAAVEFAESAPGRKSLITLLEKAREGIQGLTGTRIHLK